MQIKLVFILKVLKQAKSNSEWPIASSTSRQGNNRFSHFLDVVKFEVITCKQLVFFRIKTNISPDIMSNHITFPEPQTGSVVNFKANLNLTPLRCSVIFDAARTANERKRK